MRRLIKRVKLSQAVKRLTKSRGGAWCAVARGTTGAGTAARPAASRARRATATAAWVSALPLVIELHVQVKQNVCPSDQPRRGAKIADKQMGIYFAMHLCRDLYLYKMLKLSFLSFFRRKEIMPFLL